MSGEENEIMAEVSLGGMFRDFYNKKMIPMIAIVWVNFLIFLGLAIFSGVRFFREEQVKYQIMYAVIFICCVQMFTLLKVFGWQMIHRNGIKRQINRLEQRIAELSETVKAKQPSSNGRKS